MDSKPSIKKRTRLVSWVGKAELVGEVRKLSEAQMARYLPVDLMAHLPDGSVACVLVACRVGEFGETLIPVEVRIAANLWGDDVAAWARNALMHAIEKAFVAVASAGLPPMQGSEVEIVAYYAKGVEETVEMFARYLGVMVGMHQEYLAEPRRKRDATFRSERQKRLAEAERVIAKAARAQRWWYKVGAVLAWPFVALFNAVFPPAVLPPVVPPSLPVLPPDVWAPQAELFSSTFLAACEAQMGSLLRHVTIRDPKVAEFLQLTEGVTFGESKTMAVDRGETPLVTRMPSGSFRRSSIFDGDDEIADVDAPLPHDVTSISDYETTFKHRSGK